jgi:hypothetical protein
VLIYSAFPAVQGRTAKIERGKRLILQGNTKSHLVLPAAEKSGTDLVSVSLIKQYATIWMRLISGRKPIGSVPASRLSDSDRSFRESGNYGATFSAVR